MKIYIQKHDFNIVCDIVCAGVRGNHSVMASTMLRKKYTAELDHWYVSIQSIALLLFCERYMYLSGLLLRLVQ